MKESLLEKLETLSKLELDDTEKGKLTAELREIIEYFGVLSTLDTHGVEPADSFGGLVNVLRSDEAGPSLSSDEIIRAAKSSENGAFTVPRTVE